MKTVSSSNEFETIAKKNGYDVVYDRIQGKLRAFDGTEHVGVYEFTRGEGHIKQIGELA